MAKSKMQIRKIGGAFVPVTVSRKEVLLRKLDVVVTKLVEFRCTPKLPDVSSISAKHLTGLIGRLKEDLIFVQNL